MRARERLSIWCEPGRGRWVRRIGHGEEGKVEVYLVREEMEWMRGRRVVGVVDEVGLEEEGEGERRRGVVDWMWCWRWVRRRA